LLKGSPFARWIGPVLIITFFAILISVPKLRKTQFRLEEASKRASTETFPLDISLKTADKNQRPFSLKEKLAEHPKGLLINFWATWCTPCLEELPSLELLSKQLSADPNLPQLIAISEDETWAEVPKLLDSLSFKTTFLSLHDPSGGIAKSVGTEKFPETYWIDSNGKILYKWIGPQNWMSEDILKLLGGAATSANH
jgi:thiol-disulfide isomerase/thioredoxin